MPTITCPPAAEVTCISEIQALVDAQRAAFSTSGVTTSCNFTFTVDDNYTLPADPCATSVTVTYTVTDQCGNTATCDQVFTVVPDMPTITCPPAAEVARKTTRQASSHGLQAGI